MALAKQAHLGVPLSARFIACDMLPTSAMVAALKGLGLGLGFGFGFGFGFGLGLVTLNLKWFHGEAGASLPSRSQSIPA